MATLGRRPGAAPLTSADIPDNSITAAKVTADVATQAELDAAAFDDNKIQTNIALLAFKTAANGSLAKYELQDQIVDEYETEAGVNTGDSTNQVYASGVSYSGQSLINATGGTIVEPGAYTGGLYRSHTFLIGDTGDDFTVPAGLTSVDYLVVAGGGGGGEAAHAGGGGAGGFLTATGFGVSAQAYEITVGDGGSGASGEGDVGSNSVFSSITANGGGGGGQDGSAGANGGSGGGAGWGHNTGGTGSQGNDGGVAGMANAGNSRGAAGGGGHSAGGGDYAPAATSKGTPASGGDGGAGTANNYRDGSSGSTAGLHIFAGGGGGGALYSTGSWVTTKGDGGDGGGGDGGQDGAGSNGTDNTGGGGGGAGLNAGGDGGSGIVVIRYLAYTFADITLQSSDTTAEAAPTKADIVMLVEDAGSGVASLNTGTNGLQAYISMYETGGTKTWTQATLTDEGDWGTDKRILVAHDVTLTGTSGTQMAYKITTHNASAVYDTRIHATSIGWR